MHLPSNANLERFDQFPYIFAFALCLSVSVVQAAEPDAPLPLVFQDDFAKGHDRWQPLGGNWSLTKRKDGGQAFRVSGKSLYKPSHRSPLNIALLKDAVVGDFELTAEVQSTSREYGHRDMCLFFGYQDPKHFYYVHLGRKADPNAHQIFIVNDAPRTKITERGTDGTPWDDGWHKVRIVRQAEDGLIEVYFDDLKTPIMTARDTTFSGGQIGLGTFDDEGNWDSIVLRGTPPKPAR